MFRFHHKLLPTIFDEYFYYMMYFQHMMLEMPTYTDLQLLRKVVVEEVFLIVEWKCEGKYQTVRSILTTHGHYLKKHVKRWLLNHEVAIKCEEC